MSRSKVNTDHCFWGIHCAVVQTAQLNSEDSDRGNTAYDRCRVQIFAKSEIVAKCLLCCFDHDVEFFLSTHTSAKSASSFVVLDTSQSPKVITVTS